MYSGGDLAKLLKERPPASHLQISATEEGNKYNCPPFLATYLTLLNNLAQHDLNFQNLLVLNLVSLGLDFGESRRSDDHRFQPWDRRRNCLTELVDSFGKHKIRQDDKGNATSYRAHHENTKQVLGTIPSPAHFPNGGVWDPSTQIYGQDEQLPYCHGEWMPSHWTQWNGDDVQMGFVVHSDGTWEEVGSNSVGQLDEDTVGNGEENNQICDENELLYKCNSWPVPTNVDASEGLGCDVQNCGATNPVQNGSLEFTQPFKLDWQAEIDRRSDLERFMEVATPSLPFHDSEHQFTDACESLSMEDIWQFYELPSVFGLQVPFFKGSSSISFAHFVPSLSAIRLFKKALSSSSEDPSHKEIFLCDNSKHPQFMRLVFEFFETEKPHVRRPLFEEIKQLSTVGFSGKCLPNLQLSEIHPSSWFSVAWYPIYCIPEGRLRTSFLTFHSFGTPSNVNNKLGRNNILEAQLIGIKFTSLSREAWIRPSSEEKNKSPEFQSKPLDEHAQHSRTKNGMELPQASNDRHSPPNGCTVADDHDRIFERPRDLEYIVECLQSNAEQLARARIRRVAHGSGSAAESHKCYHPDFEFFHQRS